MADLIKDRMDAFLYRVERQLGPIRSLRTHELNRILETNYQAVWGDLERNTEIFKSEVESGAIMLDYLQGQELLTSSWHQGDPYNRQCPAPPSGDDCTSTNTSRSPGDFGCTWDAKSCCKPTHFDTL
jgi:hypothetical protein